MDALLPNVTDPRGYPFWLMLVSLLVMGLERAFAWRRSQRVLRRGFGQDLLWLWFHGHAFALLLGILFQQGIDEGLLGLDSLRALNVLSGLALGLQFALAFVFKDFLEWGVHNLLHRVPWLWEFHKVHHSIEELDWIGNFRFHWMENVIYRALTWIPLAPLGVDPSVLLAMAITSTLIGHLNHANLPFHYGPLRFVINSPRMHVWHHAKDLPPGHPHGVNFGIALSLWDWLFQTAHWPSPADNPKQAPERLGFHGQELLPQSFLARLAHPFLRFRRGRPAGDAAP